MFYHCSACYRHADSFALPAFAQIIDLLVLQEFTLFSPPRRSAPLFQVGPMNETGRQFPIERPPSIGHVFGTGVAHAIPRVYAWGAPRGAQWARQCKCGNLSRARARYIAADAERDIGRVIQLNLLSQLI
jgi:hypothetical protein